MTLTTKMRIIEPHPIKPVWAELNRLIGSTGARTKEYHQGEAYFTPTNGTPPWLCRNNQILNEPGQGFPALIDIEWGADGPLNDELSCDEDNCPAEYGTCDNPDHLARKSYDGPVASIEMSFDTPYGYRAANGAGCSDIHAYIIYEMGKWLTARDLTWWWYDEFRGEWHEGFAELGQLGNPLSHAAPERADRGFEFMVKNGRFA